MQQIGNDQVRYLSPLRYFWHETLNFVPFCSCSVLKFVLNRELTILLSNYWERTDTPVNWINPQLIGLLFKKQNSLMKSM